MKKITLLFIALLTTGTMIMAQGGPRGGQRNMDPKDRAERMTERMVKEYSLSDAQKAQLYDVNLAMAEKMTPPRKMDANKEAKKDAKIKGKACCENCANCDSCKVAPKDKRGKHAKHGKSGKMDNKPSKEDREKMMGAMKQSREDYNAKIEKIFTKEQYEAYTKKQAERQKRMGEKGQRGERGQRPQRTNS
ncbi:DUF4890 domain-containing protein [Bacteroides sp. 51]|uniref:DUF4890 domain-containing protein n=1 Tax=Bacteroides sp. 51 TaxID=2302938 RepID=UPI0013D43BC0|nr:DUF4890 domain-containing protein [Bacteroides sp. 51]NDV83696.1 DUF4890 domain-containing protein [Bacteroides sp. 51]